MTKLKASIYFLLVFVVACTNPNRRMDSERVFVCAHCDKVISGRYIVALDKTWHPRHFVCAKCGKELGGSKFVESNGKLFCRSCYIETKLPRCNVCSKPLTDDYYRDIWGTIFHTEHIKELPKCFSCGRLVSKNTTGGGETHDHDRVICNLCNKTAVKRNAEARHYFMEVTAFFRERYDMSMPTRGLPVLLTNQETLAKSSPHDLSPTGRTEKASRLRNGRVVQRRIERILILYGLPREHFQTVSAHEFGHAWLFLNRFPNLPLRVEEGFCELMQHLWLEGQNEVMAKRRLEVMQNNKHNIYGRGYREAYHAYKKLGLQRVLTNLRLKRNFE